MANELRSSMQAVYNDASGTGEVFNTDIFVFSIPSHIYSRFKFTVGTTDTTIPVPVITLFGYTLFYNRDTTSTVYLKEQAAGKRIATLLPGVNSAAGGWSYFFIGPDVTSPVMISTPSTAEVDVFIFNGN